MLCTMCSWSTYKLITGMGGMDTDLSDREKNQLSAMTPLIKKRVSVSLFLSLFLLVGYALYGFLLTGDGQLAGQKVWGQMTLVFLVSSLMVVFGVIVAGFYTWWCRHHLDPHVESIKQGQADE